MIKRRRKSKTIIIDFTFLDFFNSVKIGVLNVQRCKNNRKQIEPHSSKELCDHYIRHKLIYGCGKPFQIIINDDNFIIEICDYI